MSQTPVRKRPSIAEVADAIEGIGRAPTNEVIPATGQTPVISQTSSANEEPYWRKTTIPFRNKQLTDVEDIVKRWQLDLRVKVSIAEMLRFALDRVLSDIGEDPDRVLVEIHQMYQREMATTPTRKFGRTSGLEKYLKRKKLL